MPPPTASLNSVSGESSSLSLGWKSEDAFLSIFPHLIDLASTKDWTDKREIISSLVDGLTIQSTQFAQDLTNHLTTQGKEFQPAFSRIAMVENTEGEANEALASDALIPLQSAMGRVITKDLNQRGNQPGYLEMLNNRLAENSKLTQFEGRFIPMLFIGEIYEPLAEWRRNTWKDLLTDDARVDFLREILDLLRSDEHGSGTAMDVVEFDMANDLKGSWGFDATRPFIIVITDEQRAAWVNF